MPDRTLTGAIAIVKDQEGNPIGKMQSIRAQENYRRQPVVGLSRITPKEAPVVGFEATLSCQFYEVAVNKSGIPKAIRRDVDNRVSTVTSSQNENFEDQLVLDEDGVRIEIYKKVTDVIDPDTGLIRPQAIPYATIARLLINSDEFNVNEGQIAGRNQNFQYLDPIITGRSN